MNILMVHTRLICSTVAEMLAKLEELDAYATRHAVDLIIVPRSFTNACLKVGTADPSSLAHSSRCDDLDVRLRCLYTMALHVKTPLLAPCDWSFASREYPCAFLLEERLPRRVTRFSLCHQRFVCTFSPRNLDAYKKYEPHGIILFDSQPLSLSSALEFVNASAHTSSSAVENTSSCTAKEAAKNEVKNTVTVATKLARVTPFMQDTLITPTICPVYVVPSIGCINNKLYAAPSFVLQPHGTMSAYCAPFEQRFCLYNTDQSPTSKDKLSTQKLSTRIQKNPDYAYMHIWDALCMGIQDRCAMFGAREVVCVMDGGLASSVLAALLVDALGALHVHALIAPRECSYDFTAANTLATALGIDARTCNDMSYGQGFRTLQEKIHVREGALVGYAQTWAQTLSAVLVSSCDKLSYMLGVYTLFDTCTRIAPLADLLRCDVERLARARMTRSALFSTCEYKNIEYQRLQEHLSVPATCDVRTLDSNLHNYLYQRISAREQHLAAQSGVTQGLADFFTSCLNKLSSTLAAPFDTFTLSDCPISACILAAQADTLSTALVPTDLSSQLFQKIDLSLMKAFPRSPESLLKLFGADDDDADPDDADPDDPYLDDDDDDDELDEDILLRATGARDVDPSADRDVIKHAQSLKAWLESHGFQTLPVAGGFMTVGNAHDIDEDELRKLLQSLPGDIDSHIMQANIEVPSDSVSDFETFMKDIQRVFNKTSDDSQEHTSDDTQSNTSDKTIDKFIRDLQHAFDLKNKMSSQKAARAQVRSQDQSIQDLVDDILNARPLSHEESFYILDNQLDTFENMEFRANDTHQSHAHDASFTKLMNKKLTSAHAERHLKFILGTVRDFCYGGVFYNHAQRPTRTSHANASSVSGTSLQMTHELDDNNPYSEN
ncbi:NAD synthase [Fannyhessea vaginae]|uniref:NAD(+) synthase n=1 Tax=Fannyhessea vaginae TaxID=82135 RepID=UPI00065E89B2|nr:NAD(+) synthase [Fannyhessea vaginae]KMT47834.1 NAD synthase [Fannyhessea vaginae]